MKSKIKVIAVLFIACFLVGSHAVFCNQQKSVGTHPFYDAKNIYDAFTNGEINEVISILAKYSKTEIKTVADAQKEFGRNPFLSAWLTELSKRLPVSKKSPKTMTKGGVEPVEVTSAATGILSPTMVVDALGRLIAERFKEELAIAYLTKFRDEVKENKLRSLFPSTADFLTSSDIFNFKVFIPTLKDAFQNDLNSLDSNLKKFLIERRRILVENYNELFKMTINELEDISISQIKNNITLINVDKDKLKNEIDEFTAGQLWEEVKQKRKELEEKEKVLAKLKDIEQALTNKDLLNFAIVILDIIEDIKEGDHLIEVIESIDKSPSLDKIEPGVSSLIRVLALVSRNLMNEKGDGWIDAEEFKTLVEPDKSRQRNLFIGLVYARETMGSDKLEKIKFNGDSLKAIIGKISEKDIPTIEPSIKKSIEFIEKISYMFKKIKGKIDVLNKIKTEGKEIGFEEYYSYLKTVFELIDIGVDIKEITGDAIVFDRIKEYLDYGRKLLEISKYIHEKAYGIAFVNALDLLKELLSDESLIKKGILKYGTFMVNLVKAENSTEMKNVLEAAFLPVESYRIKRTSHFNISLNAYPGGFIGGENLTPGEQKIMGDKLGMNLAFTAPVGIAFSWGNDKEESKEKKLGPSRTIFLSAIDIGAVVSFRLSGADSGLPEFKWQNILAPGLYYMHGFKNSPISIGVGIQYGPQLRKIRAAEPASGTNNGENGGEVVNEAVITSSAFKFGLIVAVDIPLFNIHSK